MKIIVASSDLCTMSFHLSDPCMSPMAIVVFMAVGFGAKIGIIDYII